MTNLFNRALAAKLFLITGLCLMALTVSASPTVTTRDTVEVLYGYLKIFPNELGTFESEPTTVIAQINKHAQHGYNNWRIPTDEELSLLRANGYLGDGQYMSRERQNGIVLLVSDGEDYATLQEARQAEEAQKAALQAQGWVDLGLPSGTLWSDQNEPEGFYTYDQVKQKFGDNLPTKAQLEELINSCTWTWTGSGYKVVGPSGESITLPAAGYRDCDGRMKHLGSVGHYWSSTPNGADYVWYLYIDNGSVNQSIGLSRQCFGLSVRLVRQ